MKNVEALFAALFVTCCTFAERTIAAQTISYVVPAGTVGNQDLSSVPQSLGMDFDVNSPIVITSLGVFDSGGDGLVGALRAHIYDRDTQMSLGSLAFTPSQPGTLTGGSRFKSLTNSITLPAGFHGTVVVDYLTTPTEPNGNWGHGAGSWTTDSGGGLISFVGSARTTVSGIGYPSITDGGPENRYAAGTFIFAAASGTNQPPPPPPQADYDLSLDFAISSNPNGVWSYGRQETVGGAFTLFGRTQTNVANGVPIIVSLMSPYTQPAILHNDTTQTAVTDGGASYPPETTWFGPGVQGYPGNYAVARFTVPAGGGGTYQLVTTARPAFSPEVQLDTDFHVTRNNVEIFGAQLNGAQTAGYTNTLTLAAGDTLDFAVGRGADNSYIWSVLKVEAAISKVSTNGGVAPTIVSQPASQTVTEGGSATFSVTATGSEPLRYQWRRGDHVLAGATASTLTLTNVQLSHAGNYRVVVSNAFGTIISEPATLAVTPDGGSGTNCVPVREGLVSWWRAEGDAQDSRGLNHGTVIGGGFASGVRGQAFSFDGDDRVAVPDSSSLAITPSLTVEGWLKIRDWPSQNDFGAAMVVFRGDDRSGLDAFYVTVLDTGILRFAITATNEDFVAIDAPVVTNRFIHFAATIDDASGDISLYLDGSLAARTNTTVRPIGDLGPFGSGVGIGNGHEGSVFRFGLNGLVDELKLYSRALTVAEVGMLYTNAPCSEPPPSGGDFNLSLDFSLASNPNGVWSYGRQETIGGEFTLLGTAKTNYANVPMLVWAINALSQPAILHNDTTETVITPEGTYSPETTWFAPGVEGYPGNYAVARLTVPAGGAGTYRLRTTARPSYHATLQLDTDFHVARNNVEIFGAQLNGAQSAGYTNTLTLAAGDTIDFAVGRGADNSYIWSQLKVEAVISKVSTNGGVAPTIVSQPASQTVTEGGSATFSVTASGSEPLRYQWRRGDQVLGGATGATLTLTNVQLSHAGNYRVVVSNAFGTVISEPATLTVNPVTPEEGNYDLSLDFALTSNPNGVWSYGRQETIGGEFTLLGTAKTNYANVPMLVWAINELSQPAILHNDTTETVIIPEGEYPPETTWFGPGVQGQPGNYAVARLRVPAGGGGTYRLVTRARPSFHDSIQLDTDFHVVRNNVEIFGVQLNGAQTAGYTNTLSLAAGDTIDFTVGRGVDDSYILSQLKVEATLTRLSPTLQLSMPNATGGDGTCALTFNGLFGNYTIEASTNLIQWVTLTNVVGATGQVRVNDPASGSLPQRFYRARIVE